MGTPALSLTPMTCESFVEQNDKYFEERMQEMYWEWDGSIRTNELYDMMVKMAKEMCVQLTDLEVWDYDYYFYNWYQSMEKGLS